jgi:hypothetical protein
LSSTVYRSCSLRTYSAWWGSAGGHRTGECVACGCAGSAGQCSWQGGSGGCCSMQHTVL